jgi:hypothetical protein
MAKQTNKPAGGLGSRVVNPQGQRLGQKATGMHVGGVSQLGEAVGNHVTHTGKPTGYRGDPWTDGRTPAGGKQMLGNAAAQATVCGPGGSRQIHSCGSQTGVSPTKSPNASTRDTLSEYGPDSANARNRR